MIGDISDSAEETYTHILRVHEFMTKVAHELELRALHHDQSKLKEPEKSAFDALVGRLHGVTYGSEEYKQTLRTVLGPALKHHYAVNSHHPEHYANGIAGMSLLDLVEMFCDWKAATERHADGSLEKSIEHNKDRFGIDSQLVSILENTRKEMGW
jgi:hypothetical protein